MAKTEKSIKPGNTPTTMSNNRPQEPIAAPREVMAAPNETKPKILKVSFSPKVSQEGKTQAIKMLQRNGFNSQAFYEKVKKILHTQNNADLKELGINRSLERKDPTLVFENGAIVSDNFLHQYVDDKTLIKVNTMTQAFKNSYRTCQSTAFVFLKIVKLVENIIEKWDMYFDADGNEREITVQSMNVNVMEDLAVYSFVCDGMFPYYKDCEKAKKLHEKRCGLIEELSEKFKDFVENERCGPAFDKKSLTSGHSWFFFISSLIKRSYDVNVFAGDGTDFWLAYVGHKGETETENHIFVRDFVHIVHQAYNNYFEIPEEIECWRICFEGHAQFIFCDKKTGTLIQFNCMGRTVEFDSSNGTSSIIKACNLLTAWGVYKEKEESLEPYIDFTNAKCSKKKFIGFFNIAILRD